MAVAQALNENDRIRTLVPLNTLSKERFDELMKGVSVETVKAGQLLFDVGDVDQHNVYLLSGQVSLIQGGREVDRVDAAGEVARFPLAHQFPRKQAGRALQDGVTCLRIDNRVLSEILSRGSGSGYEVEELDFGGSDDWMEQLLGARVTRLMPTANLQEVLRKMEEVQLSKGDEVFHQGDQGDYYYFISRGKCRLTRSEDGGMEQEIAQLGPGDSFGEDALLSGSPRSCTISMLTDGVLIRLSKENFDQLIKQPLSRAVGYGEAKRRAAAGAVWMDVRTPTAYAAGHLPGSMNLPFDLLRYQVESLANDCEYLVYCDDESTSTAAAYLLTERGLKVAVLRRGLAAVPGRDLEADASVPAGRPMLAPTPQSQSDDEGRDLDFDLNLDLPPETEAAYPRSASAAAGPGGPSPAGALAAVRKRNQILEARLAALEAQQQAQPAPEVVDTREWEAKLADAERRFKQQEQEYEGELAELRNALAMAEKEAMAATTGKKPSDDSGREVLRLKQALNSAETQLRKVNAELEEAEDRHIAETDEVHQLWEKRLRALERELDDVRAERDDLRRGGEG